MVTLTAVAWEISLIASLEILKVVSQPFDENTYLIHKPGDAACLIVDPGLEPDKILQTISDRNLQPAVILNTHGHSDHIAGNEAIKTAWPEIPLVIGHEDAEKLTNPVTNLSRPFGIDLISPPADQLVRDAEEISFAGISMKVLETPGHSIGHVVFVIEPMDDASPTVVIGGDVLFQGSIGRTDFPDGSFEQLQASIHNKLFTLPANTIVLPGHGPATTVGQEIEANPFVGKPAGYSL